MTVQTTEDVGGSITGGDYNTHKKNSQAQCTTNLTRGNYNNNNYYWSNEYDTSGPSFVFNMHINKIQTQEGSNTFQIDGGIIGEQVASVK